MGTAETAATALDLGRVAYEARWEGFTLGPRGDAPGWSDLPPEARAVWLRVGRKVAAATARAARTGGERV